MGRHRPGRPHDEGSREGLGSPPGLTGCLLCLEGLDLAVLEWPAAPLEEQAAGLTPAESAVVRLALQGLSNEAIAARRRRALRTVANQLESAFAKLGVGSRAELAARLAHRGEGR